MSSPTEARAVDMFIERFVSPEEATALDSLAKAVAAKRLRLEQSSATSTEEELEVELPTELNP